MSEMIRDFLLDGVWLQLEQDPALGYGGTVWDAALVLSAYLSSLEGEFTPSTRVLELGSGTGLCGFHLQKRFGCEVVVTDVPALLPLLERNKRRNDCNDVSIVELRWETEQSLGRFDYVLGSDLVYEQALHPHLLNTIEANAGGQVILSFEMRKAEDLAAVDELQRRGWTAQLIEQERLRPDCRAIDIAVVRFRRR